MRVATLIIPGERRGRGIFLQQNNSSESVSNSYFKMPLAMYRLHKGRGGRVFLIDIIGSRVLWAFENSKGDAGIIRFAKKINIKGKSGFSVKGKFLEF